MGIPLKPSNRIWSLAEKADWKGWRPRFFWRWLLKRCDRSHGHYLDYNY